RGNRRAAKRREHEGPGLVRIGHARSESRYPDKSDTTEEPARQTAGQGDRQYSRRQAMKLGSNDRLTEVSVIAGQRDRNHTRKYDRGERDTACALFEGAG